MVDSPTILLGVTADQSLALMRGFPEHLRDAGWNVHVVSSDGPELRTLSAMPGITTHAIEMRRQPSPFRDLASLLSWILMLRRVRPIVTSLGTPKAGLLGGVAAKLTRVPRRVYHLRGLRLETARGISLFVLSLMERISIWAAHDVLAVSESLRAKTITLRLASAAKIHVLGKGSSNGVDLDWHDPDAFNAAGVKSLAQSLRIDLGVPVIGFVGRLSSDKGLAVLAQARVILANRGVDHQLLVVGGIDGAETAELLTSIRRSGRPAIETGHVVDPRPYYLLMDVLCLPTFREGFPNVVLEAAALGIPTVTTTATGAIDSVVDGTTGLLADVGSAESLADALHRLLQDRDAARAMGAAARTRAAIDYDRRAVWARSTDYYRALADHALHGRSGSSNEGRPT